MATKDEKAVSTEQPTAPAVQLVKMVRDNDKYPAPHTALVHPDEVMNYYLGGWIEEKTEQK